MIKSFFNHKSKMLPHSYQAFSSKTDAILNFLNAFMYINEHLFNDTYQYIDALIRI